MFFIRNIHFWGWRGDLKFNRPCCSHRRPGFDSKHPQGASQPSITPVPKELKPSSYFLEHWSYTWYTYIQVCTNEKKYKGAFTVFESCLELFLGICQFGKITPVIHGRCTLPYNVKLKMELFHVKCRAVSPYRPCSFHRGVCVSGPSRSASVCPPSDSLALWLLTCLLQEVILPKSLRT